MNEAVSRRFSTYTVSKINQQSNATLHLRYVKPGAVTLASLRYACGWVPLTDKQSTTKKTLELMGHLRTVEMRRRSPKTRRNPSVSSHTVSKINQQSKASLHCVAEQRKATHEHVSTCRHPCVRANGNLRAERWRRQAPWHPHRVRTINR